ncbi:MAG: phosphohydrolase [Leptothrix sp. (in: Bacteria)]|nr:phosphohydrolase [Leptothrix sp. (in: b-proteobacteria)]
MTSTIAVRDLRVGMYVHLDGGWLSHPFPLSAFRIATAEEIATIRGLGLERVRWDAHKSDLPDAGQDGLPVPAASATVGAWAPVADPAQLAASREHDWLAAQRRAAQRCEQQYSEAAKSLREVGELLNTQPEQAGRTTTALTQAMLDKMLAAEDVGVRLVCGTGADRGAAHGLNVAVIALLIGRTLGLGPEEMLDVGVGALLHDIGKQDVPTRLRHAEEGFTAAEVNGYRDHVAKGVLLGKRMALSAGALAVIAQHHENADGSGFPLRLPADRLSLGARIVAIVNRYDNLCNPGSRNLALTPHEAVATLFAQGRSRFDPPVLNAFIRMMGVYPAGSLVQLTDDRYAMVVGANSTRPLKPLVLVHGRGGARPDPRAAGGSGAQLVDLETQPDIGIRRSLPAAKLPPAVLSALDPRPRVAYYFEPLSEEPQAMEFAA